MCSTHGLHIRGFFVISSDVLRSRVGSFVMSMARSIIPLQSDVAWSDLVTRFVFPEVFHDFRWFEVKQ